MGNTVCSRCRRGSVSSTNRDTDFNSNGQLAIEPRSHRPQSAFSLHNIDTLANDTNTYRIQTDADCRETETSTDPSSQRTSIENENASVESKLQDEDQNCFPIAKRKSSFSDCSTNRGTSMCSSQSSVNTNKGGDVSNHQVNSIDGKEETDEGICNEAFIDQPEMKVRKNVIS